MTLVQTPESEAVLSGASDGGDVAAALAFAKDHIDVIEVAERDDQLIVAVPAGYKVESLDLEPFGEAPARKRGKVTLHTGQSLAAYVNHHTVTDATALYADVEARRVVAVLDGHHAGSDNAGWGEHRAALALRHTPEWLAWIGKNGQMRDQVAFAEHIEENLLDIVDPAGADMLELAQTFQATTKVSFKSSQRLSSGEQQLTYLEDTDAKAGAKGDLIIPTRFELALRPFEGTEPYRVTARLRYRIGGGDLAIGYVLDRPEDVVRDAFDQILADIETETGLGAYRGTEPPAAK